MDPVFEKIYQQISNIFPTFNNQDEFEARFTPYTNYLPQLEQIYNRVLQYYGEKNLPTVFDNYTVESMPEGNADLRKIIRNTNINWIRKTRIRDVLGYENYNLKFALSTEELIDKPGKKFIPTLIRSIERTSIEINRYSRLDVSKVVVMNNKNKDTDNNAPTYQFELELLSPTKNKLNDFFKALSEVYKLIHDTTVVYPKQVYSTQFSTINRVLSYKSNDHLDRAALYKARDLKYPDLVASAFLDGKTRVAFKTDGVRRALIIDKNGVWLTFGNSLNWVTKQNASAKIWILDGELVPMTKRTGDNINQRYYYVIFDVLMSDDRDVRDKSHKARLSELDKLTLIRNDILYMEAKPFYDYETADNFFSTMRLLEDKIKPKLSYIEDGYIFVSNNMKYNSGNDKLLPSERLLIKHEDMCKWKPLEKLTIDFRIIKTDAPNNYHLYNFDSSKGSEVHFNSGPPSVNITDETLKITSGAIVEFAYNSENKVWLPIRVRTDRSSPNGINEARDVWNLIQSPISIETLRGETLNLMRKYHNRVKATIYGSVQPGATLLDIGSGKGGTIRYWQKYGKIIAVEPDLNNVAELYKRLNGEAVIAFPSSDIETLYSLYNHLGYKVFILVTGGENYKLITKIVQMVFGNKVDCIASMFSLTFFWQSKSMLAKLKKTIKQNLKPNGKLLYSVMDGSSVKNIFEPIADNVAAPAKNRIKNSLYTITYGGSDFGDPLKIYLKGTIVGEEEAPQIEYLAFVENLFHDTFTYMSVHKFDNEDFMNEYEKYLSSLFIFGIMGTLYSTPNVLSESDLDDEPLLGESFDELFEGLAENQGGGTKRSKTNIDSSPGVDFYEGPPPALNTIDNEPKEKQKTAKLPKLSENVRNEKGMEDIAIKDVAAPIVQRVGHRTIPLIINNNENKVVDEEEYARIATKYGLYGGFYEALLNAFFGPYASAEDDVRETYIKSMIDHYGEPNIVEISRDLNLSIIIIELSNEGQILLYDYVIQHSRPVVILATINYDHTLYFETVGRKEVVKYAKKDFNMYRTIFNRNDDLVTKFLLKPFNIISEYTSSIIASGSNRKLKNISFNVISTKELDKSVTIVDNNTYIELRVKTRRLSKLINEDQVQSIIKDTYPQIKTKRIVNREIVEIIDYEGIAVAGKKVLEIGNKQIYKTLMKSNKISRVYLISDNVDQDIKFDKSVKVLWSKNFMDLYGDEQDIADKINAVDVAVLTITDNYRSYISQIIIAINSLSIGGSIILRVLNSDNDFFQSIIYVFTHIFTTVKLAKSSQSIPYESYRYIIATSIKPSNILNNVIKLFNAVKSETGYDNLPQSVVPLQWMTEDVVFTNNSVSVSRKYDNSEIRAIDAILTQIVQ